MLPAPRDIIQQLLDEELGDFLSENKYVRFLKEAGSISPRGELTTRLPYRIEVE